MPVNIQAIRQRLVASDFFDDWEQDGNRIRNSRGIVAVCPTPQNGGTFSCAKIAALLTHAPADLAALCDEVERLRAGLVKYGHHTLECHSQRMVSLRMDTPDPGCSCGLAELLPTEEIKESR